MGVRRGARGATVDGVTQVTFVSIFGLGGRYLGRADVKGAGHHDVEVPIELNDWACEWIATDQEGNLLAHHRFPSAFAVRAGSTFGVSLDVKIQGGPA